MLTVLIPTYGRPQRIKSLVDNIRTTTEGEYTTLFIIERDDKQTIAELKRLEQKYIYNQAPYTYVSAINTGYTCTDSPYVFCGSDDIVLPDCWNTLMLEYMREGVGVVGAYDNHPVVRTGLHSEHFMVRREYAGEYIYHPEYKHYYCDLELIQTAIQRGAFVQAKNVEIRHNVWYLGRSDKDNTYEKEGKNEKHDRAVYDSRRGKFEQYILDEAWKGKAVRVNKGTLSIVMPSYQCLPYLKITLDSLLDNTYHNFQLIIIDDCSDKSVRAFLTEIEGSCTVVYNKKKRYVTGSWNDGLKLATGDYVAIINNDITFSKNWDAYLMDALNNNVWIASPYMTDPIDRKPFANIQRFNNIMLAGPCYMMKRKTFDTIGLFPESTRIWYNDVWLSWVVTEKYKKKAIFIPEALIHHYKSKASQTLSEQNREFWVDTVHKDKLAFNRIKQDWEAKQV